MNFTGSGSPAGTILTVDSAVKELSRLACTAPLNMVLKALGTDFPVYLVGGTIRDVLLGKIPEDFDLACLLKPDIASHRLHKAGIYVVATGLKHGTITAVLGDHHIEITTFRKPSPSSSTAPEASDFSDNILDDLNGRDFTVNAMAFQPQSSEFLDPWAGYHDLQKGLIKAVESSYARFKEDPLRILRMIRLGPASGLCIDKTSSDAARELAFLVKNVSIERVRVELEKILLSTFPANGIRSLRDHGLLELVLPELLPAIGFEQNKYHTQDVFEHTLSVLESTPPDLLLRLTAIFHDVGKPATLSVDEQGERHFYEHEKLSEEMCREAMKRLKFSNDQIHDTSLLVRMHMRPIECGPSGIRRLMRDLGPLFDRFRTFQIADSPPVMPKEDFMKKVACFDSMVSAEIERQKNSQRKLAVDGNDLLQMGYKSGPYLGSVLKELDELVIENPELNVREVLLERARAKITTFKAG